jgi:hypothetical protein
MKNDLDAINKHVPLGLQNGLAVITEDCPDSIFTIDFTDLAVCRVVVTVPLKRKFTADEIAALDRAFKNARLTTGEKEQAQQETERINSVMRKAGTIAEQWGNLLRAEIWIKEGIQSISPEDFLKITRKELDRSFAELKKLDAKVYKDLFEAISKGNKSAGKT